MEIQRQPRVKSWTLVLLLKQGTPCKASIWIFSGGWAQVPLLAIRIFSRDPYFQVPVTALHGGTEGTQSTALLTGLGGVLGGPGSSLWDLVIPQSADQVGWLPNHSWLWGSKDESHRGNKCRRSWSHQNQKTYLFSLAINILLCVIAYLHLWHRYFRETFCNFSALGSWTQGFMHARQVLYYTQLHLSLWTF